MKDGLYKCRVTITVIQTHEFIESEKVDIDYAIKIAKRELEQLGVAKDGLTRDGFDREGVVTTVISSEPKYVCAHLTDRELESLGRG